MKDKKLHIAMDLDGTLVNWINTPEKIAAHKLGVEKPKITDYYYKGLSNKLRLEIFKLFKDFEFMSMNNLTYDIFDIYALDEWSKTGHTLTIITSRDNSFELKKETKRIIKEWFPMIDNTIITKKEIYKIDIFESLKLDIWIDDHPDIVNKANDLGIKTYLIDKPYNKNYFIDFKRIKNIYQLYKLGEF